MYCHRSSGALLRLQGRLSSAFAHRECRDDKACGLCGHTGMTQFCTDLTCYRVLHPWCSERYALGSATDHCDVHLFGRIREKFAVLRATLPRIPHNPQLLRTLRRLEGAGSGCCSGHVLWYYIGTNYFPAGAEVSSVPEIRKGKLSCAETSDVLNEWKVSGNGEINSLFETVVTALSYNRLKLDGLKAELQSQIQTQNLEAGDWTTEERVVLCELRMMGHKPEYEHFFKYLEGKQRDEVGADSSTSSSLSVHLPVATSSEDICAVCGLSECEDDNILIICSVTSIQTCDLAVHTKCYGVTMVPEGDWVCGMCTVYGNSGTKELNCVLCPVVGGALKVTNVRNDGTTFPQLSVFDPSQPSSPTNPEFLWCHVLCALNMSNLPRPSDFISLSPLKPDSFGTLCGLCGLRKGVCVKCLQKKCDFAFHAECGKELLARSRQCGAEEGEIYCRKHMPVRLGKLIEERDRKKVEDVVHFCRLWEKWESKLTFNPSLKRIRKRCEVEWTYAEAEALEDELTYYLKRVSERQTRSFRLIINKRSVSRSGCVAVAAPAYFNLLDAEAILSESLMIPNRSPEECYRFYSLHLQPRMRFELELCKQTLHLYAPRNSVKLRKRPTELAKRPRIRPPESKDLLSIYQVSGEIN